MPVRTSAETISRSPPQPSDRTRVDELARRYRQCGDLDARRELAELFLPLARDLALRYSYTHEPSDDLVQVASLGLLKAIDRYDPERGTTFAGFATPTILGELKRYFRDSGWAVHVPRGLKEHALAATRAIDALAKQLGRYASIQEVASELGLRDEQVLEALRAAASFRPVALDAPSDDEDLGQVQLNDRLGREDSVFELVEQRDAIARGWQALSELERHALWLRFFDDLTQREIGERIGCSQMHVSRLVRRALERLHENETGSGNAA